MNQSLDDLIDNLGRGAELFGIERPFLPYGKDAFEKLLALIQSDERPWRFVKDAMYVLFMLARECCPDKFSLLVEPTISLAKSCNEQLRSQAAQDLVRLSIVADHFPQLGISFPEREELFEILKGTISLGVTKEARTYLEAFMSK